MALISKVVEKVRSIRIKDGVNLHCIDDKKFKTTTIGVYIHTPLCAENASKNALLPMVLKRGCKKYPTFDEIEKKLGDLCGAILNCSVVKRGEDHILCFDISTISNRYYVGEENIMLLCGELLFDIILKPMIKDGAFLSEYVESEKKNLCDNIDALVNDKQSYALWRLYEIMCKDEAYGTNDLGTKEGAEAIGPCELYEHYKKLLSESKIDIFVCGNADQTDIDEFSKFIKDAFENVKTTDAPYPSTQIVSTVGEVNNVNEQFDTNQAKLSLGFRVVENVDYPAMLVTNSVWGGGPHSKLFNNVREKLSLAYYAFSRYEKFKNTVLVGMGIETQNYQKAFDETLLQLKNVCDGDFSENELASAKAYIVNMLRSQRDSQYAMLDFHMSSMIRGAADDIESLCEKVEAVSKDEVIKAANAIKLDTVYFLCGKQ
ncbi:MAG: insulinase family protein [Ruminococcaceae bacterium]|nr:insulinase family protein [Oscillospiraceae bacterium]